MKKNSWGAKDIQATSTALTPEIIKEAFDKILEHQVRWPEPQPYLVSYKRYKELEYFVGEILKVEPNFHPSDPWSIEFKAHELGIKLPAEKKC